MNRPAALTLTAVLVLSLVAPVATAQDTSRQPSLAESPLNGTAARLVVDGAGPTANGFDAPKVDASTAVSIGGTDLTARFEQYALEAKYDAATSNDERNAVLEDALDDASDTLVALQARERAAFEAYTTHQITSKQLLVELARVDATARDAIATVETVDELAGSTAATSVGRRTDRLETELEILTGPVRDRVRRSLVGDASPIRVYVRTSPVGVSLAVMDDSQFEREATRLDDRDAAAAIGNQIDIQERPATLYPWAWSNQLSASTRGILSAGIYRIDIAHPHGQLTGYIDAGTERVFREHQTLRVNAAPTRDPVVRVDGSLKITINETYAGGPVRIEVVDNATGAPVRATVGIAQEPIGVTNENGVLWIVAPHDVYTVFATAQGDEIRVSLNTSAAD